jgi:hypothetical protein
MTMLRRAVLAALATLALAVGALACAPPEPGANPSDTPNLNSLPTEPQPTGGRPDPTIMVPPPVY